jgi:hypothetical protein
MFCRFTRSCATLAAGLALSLLLSGCDDPQAAETAPSAAAELADEPAALDDAPDPEAEFTQGYAIMSQEDGSVVWEPLLAGEDGDVTPIDEIVIPYESRACWVTLLWCDAPGPATWVCECTGCSLKKCKKECKQLVNKTC